MELLASQVFCGAEKDFEGPGSSYESQNFSSLQSARWNTLVNAFSATGGVDASFGTLLNSFFNPATYSVVQTKNGHKLLALNRPLINDIIDRGFSPTRKNLGRVKAYLLLNYGDQFQDQQLPLSPSDFKSNYEYMIEEKQLGAIDSTVERQLSFVLERLTSVSTQASEIQISVSNQVSELQANISAIDSAARSKLQLKQPASLWMQKSEKHQLKSILFGCAFVALISLFAFVCWYFSESYIKALPKTKDGELSLVAASLIALPIVAIAYCLRIVIRLMNINLDLADDSRQRSAMIETYLSLLADPKTNFDDKDRAVLLTAIFRPVNASQPDVSPPTIADLLKRD